MKSQLDRRIDSARSEAEAARARVVETMGEIRHRLDPRVIASEAADDLFAGVNRLLSETTEAAKARPWAVGLGATIAGLVLGLIAKLALSDGSDSDGSEEIADPTQQKIADKS